MSPAEGSAGERESALLRASLAADAVAPLRVAESGAARVLVADDDGRTRELLAAVLGASGYDVEVVPDGHAAVERVARGGVDVALLDAVMPRLGGAEACRRIRALGDDFVPVALMFAKTDARSRVEALAIGADGYVCKPFEQTELLVVVASALQRKRARDQMKAIERELARATRYDALTEAHSFFHLHERLNLEFERAERHSEPLACCLVDVDRLKIHNEVGGRALGDEILRGVAEVVRGSIRDSDTVARYGGDELFVILPATHFAGSLVVASRIWRDIAARTFSSSGREASVTASVGVALFPSRDVRTRSSLLLALEAALLEAKRLGGDRVCVFQQEGFIYTPSGDARP